MTAHHRSGSVLLIALGITAAIVSLAFGFLVSVRQHRSGAQRANLKPLAQIACRSGVSHAVAEILDDFRRTPGVPTHSRSQVFAAFAPIDLYRAGYPCGEEYSPEDLNGNDTPVENILTELYNDIHDTEIVPSYMFRGKLFSDGLLLHRGSGRWIEVGRYHRDLIGKPFSFHLLHPAAPSVGNPDPAAMAGEPWTADVDDPTLLDAALAGAIDANHVRYRLRYAVAAIDLGGHLLASVQGPYDPSATSAQSGTVLEADVAKTDELDHAIADRHRDAFANMFAPLFSWDTTYQRCPWWAWGVFSGYGSNPRIISGSWSSSANALFARFSGGTTYQALDPGPADGRLVEVASGGAFAYCLRGPAYSPQSLLTFNNANDHLRHSAHTITPFGRASVVVAGAPQRWYEARVDTPWRVNLPTTTPATLRAMVFSYLPKESRDLVVYANSIDLFAAPAYVGVFSSPYPGSDPANPANIPADWSDDLGSQIDVQSRLPARAPLQGQNIDLCKLTTPAPFVTPSYPNSYWRDVAAALSHALIVTQYAWMGDSGVGATRYPAASADPDLAAVLGQSTIDRDADGDGAAESPGRFDTVEEVDAQFLKNLGEHPGPWATGARPSVAHCGLYLQKAAGLTANASLVAWTSTGNIKSIIVVPAAKAWMERVVNDVRMSFFGSSPQYADFRGLDLDDNGRVDASCYVGGSIAANPTTGYGPVPDRWFSLTGCFVFQKSHYYRLFVRGQVFDTLIDRPIAEENIETVIAVDPDGDLFDVHNQPFPGQLDPDNNPATADARGMGDVQVLQQRRLWNRCRTLIPQSR